MSERERRDALPEVPTNNREGGRGEAGMPPKTLPGNAARGRCQGTLPGNAHLQLQRRASRECGPERQIY
eukprot:984178-Prorocentrum_minimum.AAC.1